MEKNQKIRVRILNLNNNLLFTAFGSRVVGEKRGA